MENYTIKEAAEISGISTTTIRRYIKSGKINASLEKGRYGPEYRISKESLSAIGIEQNNALPMRRNGNNNARSPEELSMLLRDLVPLGLYQELAMKHEQLLVQYGMVRAGGQRLLEYKVESEMKEQFLKEKQEQFESALSKLRGEIEFLKKHLRVAELEIEEKNTMIRSLKEKVGVLELLSRNAITNETIEKQFMKIYSKQEEIKRMSQQAELSEEKALEECSKEHKQSDH